MRYWGLLIAGAVSPFLFTSAIPSGYALTGLLLSLAAGLKSRRRLICLLPAAFFYTTLMINDRLEDRLPIQESGATYLVDGAIGSLPESTAHGVRFLFLTENPAPPIPRRIRVYAYTDRAAGASLPVFRAGQRWRLNMELRSPRGRVNFRGSDTERWYFTDGIGALGYLEKTGHLQLAEAGPTDLHHWRQTVLERLRKQGGQAPAFRLLAALAVADRRDLSQQDRQVLAATGTGHLLAISGLHIGLAAALGFYLGRLALLVLPVSPRQRLAIPLPWLTAWLAALAYAALAGFGVSTQRALVMLSVATLVALSRRNVHPALSWMIAMALVLMADPFAPLRAGFWFSFGAVGVLMYLFLPRHGPMPAWKRLLFAQVGISLVMAPLGMYWFQQASLPGLLANLVAIPLVSLWIVPTLLLSLPALLLPGPAAAWLLNLAGGAAQGLMYLLEHLAGLQPQIFGETRPPTLAATLLATAGALVLLLPRGIPGRFAGILPMLPLLMGDVPVTKNTVMQADVLDVGQGLSVLVSTPDYLLVYDTGPGNPGMENGGWDMVGSTIRPMVAASGLRPDMVIASHADLDHAGGLERLRETYRQTTFLANLPVARAGVGRCSTPMSWKSSGLVFSVLHPSAGLPYLGNDSSCVISIRGNGASMLLSGDISHAVEQRLVNGGLGPHQWLTVPHHGSSTSSSRVLLGAVQPALALLSTAAHNRFGFPRADVLGRYAHDNVPVLSTADCGGIRVTLTSGGVISVETARLRRKAIWRWPAAENCLWNPDSGGRAGDARHTRSR